MSEQLIGQTDALHEALGEIKKQVSRDAIERVLDMIGRRHPDLDAEAFSAIQDQVKETILQNADFANCGGFEFIVVAKLEENDTLHREVIPEELNIPQPVIEKLMELGSLESNAEITAYIILNSTSINDLRNKMGAARFNADATQFLMPLFHTLIEKDPNAKAELLSAVSKLEAYQLILDIPEAVDYYFFSRENTQPHLLLGDAVPLQARKDLHAVHVITMLNILKKHLQCDR